MTVAHILYTASRYIPVTSHMRLLDVFFWIQFNIQRNRFFTIVFSLMLFKLNKHFVPNTCTVWQARAMLSSWVVLSLSSFTSPPQKASVLPQFIVYDTCCCHNLCVCVEYHNNKNSKTFAESVNVAPLLPLFPVEDIFFVQIYLLPHLQECNYCLNPITCTFW